MPVANQPAAVSKTSRWIGGIISTLLVLFFVFDGGMKLIKPAPVVEGSAKFGLPESVLVPIGTVLLVSTALYALPRTAVLGAILLTGYLGGAIATHVRYEDAAFPIVFAFGFGVLVWLGIYLRDGRLRELVPLRSRTAVAELNAESQNDS